MRALLQITVSPEKVLTMHGERSEMAETDGGDGAQRVLGRSAVFLSRLQARSSTTTCCSTGILKGNKILPG
jgi:hypothetical protein